MTEVVGLDPDRLYPSIYEEDEEAFENLEIKKNGGSRQSVFSVLEKQTISGSMVPAHAVLVPRFIMTEGKKYGCGSPDCTVGCECDRYMEIWNNVFTQFDNDGHGHYSELEKKKY